MGVRIGAEAKGDCVVEVRSGGRGVEVQTKNSHLLADGLRAVAEETLACLGAEKLSLGIADFGALDYVVAARVEAVVRVMDPHARPQRFPVERASSDRDRPRRSRLYAPGNQPRLLAGVEIHGADCVLLDLEDSVPLSEKRPARLLVKHLLARVEFPQEVWVRINPLDGEGRDDVREVLIGRPHGICLPKAESAADVLRLSEELARAEAEGGIDAGSTRILPILETARGILRCEEIAAACERVVMLAFGAEDYTRDVGARRTWEALLFARSRIVTAAKGAQVQASDTVFSDVDDETGLRDEAARARDLGFDGKGAINPRQIEPIHLAFSPSGEELEAAREIVEAAREAEAAGIGVVALDGKMVDRPVVDRSMRLIRYADRISGKGNRDA